MKSVQDIIAKADVFAREWESYRAIQKRYFETPTDHNLQMLRIQGKKVEDAANAYKGVRHDSKIG